MATKSIRTRVVPTPPGRYNFEAFDTKAFLAQLAEMDIHYVRNEAEADALERELERAAASGEQMQTQRHASSWYIRDSQVFDSRDDVPPEILREVEMSRSDGDPYAELRADAAPNPLPPSTDVPAFDPDDPYAALVATEGEQAGAAGLAASDDPYADLYA